jgi:small conductance mechanosensitive channel
MDWNSIVKLIESTITGVGLQVMGAIVLYIIGRWLISFAVGLVQKGLSRQQIEPTLLRFIGNTISVILNITLVIAILGYFGVQTTSFAALLAGAGLAIGSAWGGLLANFAAGIFLVVLRPFKVGDFISAGGITGTVEEVGLFVTKIDTPDNICTYVGNNKLFSDNIQNFSTNPYRRVDLSAQIAGGADPKQAIAALKKKIAQIPNVIAKGLFRRQYGDSGSAWRRRVPRTNARFRDPPGQGVGGAGVAAGADISPTNIFVNFARSRSTWACTSRTPVDGLSFSSHVSVSP